MQSTVIIKQSDNEAITKDSQLTQSIVNPKNVNYVLNRLNEKHQRRLKIIELREIRGLSFEAIAIRLGINNRSSVKEIYDRSVLVED